MSLRVDAKLAVSATVTADLTINTDFAQVEVDQQVINLTRFPTFFPEKRDFFLESSSIFDFATPTRVKPFYSRRIGLGDSGRVVPFLAGARVYGKAGLWTLGMLDAQTGTGDRANNLVVRVKRDLLDRSYIGAIGVQRIPAGGAGAERITNLIAHLRSNLAGRIPRVAPDKREVRSSTLPRPIRQKHPPRRQLCCRGAFPHRPLLAPQ